MLLLIYLFSISEIPTDLQNSTVPLTHGYIMLVLSLLILSLLAVDFQSIVYIFLQ